MSGLTVIVPDDVALKQSPIETTVNVKVPDCVAVPLTVNRLVIGLNTPVIPPGKDPLRTILVAKVD